MIIDKDGWIDRKDALPGEHLYNFKLMQVKYTDGTNSAPNYWSLEELRRRADWTHWRLPAAPAAEPQETDPAWWSDFEAIFAASGHYNHDYNVFRNGFAQGYGYYRKRALKAANNDEAALKKAYDNGLRDGKAEANATKAADIKAARKEAYSDGYNTCLAVINNNLRQWLKDMEDKAKDYA